jgi:transposase-like protein
MFKKGQSPKQVKFYSEAFKQHVVGEIERGVLSAQEAQRHYKISSHHTVNRWRRRYGTLGEVKVLRVMMKDEKSRIRQLEELLADEKLRNRLLNAQLDVIEEEYGEDIKKKLSTERLSEYDRLNSQRKSR